MSNRRLTTKQLSSRRLGKHQLHNILENEIKSSPDRSPSPDRSGLDEKAKSEPGFSNSEHRKVVIKHNFTFDAPRDYEDEVLHRPIHLPPFEHPLEEGVLDQRHESFIQKTPSTPLIDINALPDCGLPNQEKFLSRRQAQQLKRLMDIGDDELPLSSSFGWHRWPFENWLFGSYCRMNSKDHLKPQHMNNNHGVLAEHGLGLVLYFKLIKSLIALFSVMSILTLPSLILYGSLNVTTPEDKAFDTNKPAQLAYLTIASLGQPIPSCRSIEENQTLKFSCPGESTIESIVAYFGQPMGDCNCPLPQQPVDNHCPGVPSESSQCLSSSPCYSGYTRYNQPCCGYSIDPSTSAANLSSLMLRPNYACNSYTAPYILSSLCLHQNSCELNVSVS